MGNYNSLPTPTRYTKDQNGNMIKNEFRPYGVDSYDELFEVKPTLESLFLPLIFRYRTIKTCLLACCL